MANPLEAGAPTSGLGSLSISGFRGIDQLAIPRLGRVSLLAGRNGVGKTTVLDAMRIYAARGRFDALRAALFRREEVAGLWTEDGALNRAPALERLFHQGDVTLRTIAIGPIGDGPTLKIEEVDDHADIPGHLYGELVDELTDYNDDRSLDELRFLSVIFDGTRVFLPWQVRQSSSRRAFMRVQPEMPTATPCAPLGPGLPDSKSVAKQWDNVALSDDETLGVAALRLIFGDRVERAAVVGDRYDDGGRRTLVKLSGYANPVPLKSLGDGAVRMFGIALAIASYRNGILLIDEAENGIHYSLHSAFWNLILRSAEKYNIQVIATTHSKDCIDGFAAAALECPDISGNLVRIDRHNGKLYAVEYSKDELETAAEQHIEVR